ncbi:HET-domain-containing protein [Paramyrothecium foliicola]|nr:HET-domain-containing protein [Paramyrothecium foliicola]
MANSEQTFNLAEGWIAACGAKSKCKVTMSDFHPKRLLQLQGNSSVLLREFDSSEKPGRYATLSYCWGDAEKQILTTSDKLPVFTREGIEPSSFPLTIRDAIQVVQRLGINLIWIDALCIVQDDDADKAREIPRMGEIFRNSDLTISAATSRSVDEGFLDNNEIWSGQNLAPVWLPWRGGSDNDDNNEARDDTMETSRIGLYHNLMTALRIHDAIDDRAWTFQETLLSRRLLTFSAQGVHYTCLCSKDPSLRCNGGNPTAISGLKSPLLLSPGEKQIPKGCGWDDVVAEYSARSMSVSADKLPALSAVAPMYGTSDDWLAGLWRSRLPADLLWKPARGHLRATRQIEWRAPTWSWMSLDGPVQMKDKHLKWLDDAVEVEVTEAAITPLHDFHRFGRIKDASLKLTGFLRSLLLDQKEKRLLLRESYEPFPADGCVGLAELDCLEDGNPQVHCLPVTCLYIGLVNERDKSTGDQVGNVAAGLLLEPAAGSAYRRVGTFRSFPQTCEFFHPRRVQLIEIEPSPDFD